jgi:hypothetical protein
MLQTKQISHCTRSKSGLDPLLKEDCIGSRYGGQGQSHPPMLPPTMKRKIVRGASHPSGIDGDRGGHDGQEQSHPPTFPPTMTQGITPKLHAMADSPLKAAGPHKHYKHQIEKHKRNQQKSAEESHKVMEILMRSEMYQRTRKHMIQGTSLITSITSLTAMWEGGSGGKEDKASITDCWTDANKG